MLNKEHRIGIAYSRFEHAFGIVRGGWHDNFETWNMRVPGLQHLRVLRTSLRASTSRHPHNHGNLWLPTEHIMEFCCAVHQQIAGKQAKVDSHKLEKRS